MLITPLPNDELPTVILVDVLMLAVSSTKVTALLPLLVVSTVPVKTLPALLKLIALFPPVMVTVPALAA